jgi:Mn-dependent DtxR family transcriptional regulator
MDKLLQLIRETARDNKISCSQAFEIAEKLDVSPAKVGKALDELNIKIKGCQLGCF